MDKDILYCFIPCDSFLIKQAVLLVALVINQGFFPSIRVVVGSITSVYIITNFFYSTSE